jgi:hypothetical protein
VFCFCIRFRGGGTLFLSCTSRTVVPSFWILWGTLVDCVVFSTFVGLSWLIITIPLPGYVAAKLREVQKTTLKKTDARVQSVTESMFLPIALISCAVELFTVMSVLRMVKFFAWESRMEERIKDRRTDELKCIKRRRMLYLVDGILK